MELKGPISVDQWTQNKFPGTSAKTFSLKNPSDSAFILFQNAEYDSLS